MSRPYESTERPIHFRRNRFVKHQSHFNTCLTLFQGELEHRSPKSRYTRTSRKHFVRQLTQIERRQARIRRIRAHYQQAGRPASEEVASTTEPHHVIGNSQNYPENIPNFLQKYAGDPAVKVNQLSMGSYLCLTVYQDFVPKLRSHILPRIKEIISK